MTSPSIDFSNFEETIHQYYTTGSHPNQQVLFDLWMKNPLYLNPCKQILENPNSSKYMTHFALISLESLIEHIFSLWSVDDFLSFSSWSLDILYKQFQYSDPFLLSAFCSMYGKLCLYGFYVNPNLNFFFNVFHKFSNGNNFQKCAGLNLSTHIIESLKAIKNLNNSPELITFKEQGILLFFNFGFRVLIEMQNDNDTENFISSICDLFYACFTFDIDFSLETQMIYLPSDWDRSIGNIIDIISKLFSIYIGLPFNSMAVKGKILNLFYCFASLRMPPILHLANMDLLLRCMTQIMTSNLIAIDEDNVGNVTSIVLKLCYSFISLNLDSIESFKPFMQAVFNLTVELMDADMFTSYANHLTSLLKFWDLVGVSFFGLFNFELCEISQKLLGMFNNCIDREIDLFKDDDNYDFSAISYLTSFVMKIGKCNEKSFFDSFFDSFLKELNLFAQDPTSSHVLESRIALESLILAAPVIRKIVFPIEIIERAFFSIIIMIQITGEKCTEKASNPLIENVVIYLIKQMERGPTFIERAMTSKVIERIPIKRIQQLHSYLSHRLLLIARHYPDDDPIIDRVFKTILSFYSLYQEDKSKYFIFTDFINEFFYLKHMQIRPNLRRNIFHVKDYKMNIRIILNKMICLVLSLIFGSDLEDFRHYEILILPYIRELKKLFIGIEEKDQAFKLLTNVYGLFKGALKPAIYTKILSDFTLEIEFFNNFQIDIHFILKFYAEISDNRNNRIIFNKHSSRGLKIFKDSSVFLIGFFKEAPRNLHNSYYDLKYALRLMYNLFSNDYTCIGALSVYGDNTMVDLLVNYFNYIRFTDLSEIFQIPKVFIELVNFSLVLFKLFPDEIIKIDITYIPTMLCVCNMITEYNNDIVKLNRILTLIDEICYFCFLLYQNNNHNCKNVIENTIHLFNKFLESITNMVLRQPSLINDKLQMVMSNLFRINPESVNKVKNKLTLFLKISFNNPEE